MFDPAASAIDTRDQPGVTSTEIRRSGAPGGRQIGVEVVDCGDECRVLGDEDERRREDLAWGRLGRAAQQHDKMMRNVS